jgi:hypothetical protein
LWVQVPQTYAPCSSVNINNTQALKHFYFQAVKSSVYSHSKQCMHTDKPRLMKAQNDISGICYTILHLKKFSLNKQGFKKNVTVYYEIYKQ